MILVRFTKGQTPWNKGLSGNTPWNKGLTKEVDPRIKGGCPKGTPAWNKGLTATDDPRVKAQGREGRIFTLEQRGNISLGHMGLPQSLESRRRKSISGKGKKHKLHMPEEVYAVICSKRSKRNWKDPDYILKQLQARGTKPNKIERYLENILNSHLPDYKYNGDGRLGIVLAGLVPDFPNVNGKKQVIEVFGDYFHNPRKRELKWHQTELGRIMAYNSVGFDCLVIWEHELKELTEEEIVEKISNFSKRR